jgi:Putative Ig domain
MKLKTLTLGLLTILGLCTALLAQRTLNPQTNAIALLSSGALAGHTLTISATLPPATMGESYSATFTASGGTAPYHFTVSSGQLPTGLVLSKTTGVISGTPSQSGTFSFTISATDLHLHSGTHTFQITVSKAPSVVVTVSPTTATLTSAATQQFSALVTNTSNLAVTWSASLGTISSAGLYTAPTVSANTTTTVTATSVADPTKSSTASVTITPPPVSITTSSLSNATVGTTYSNTLIATGGTTPYSWTLSSGSLPTGITLQSSGLISGTTSQSGQFTITVQVSDSSSPKQTSSKSLTLTVIAAVSVTVNPSTITLVSGASTQFTATVTNTSNLSVTWSASLGTISNTGLYQAPTVSANTTATITATSAADPTKSATASVTITPPPLSLTTTSLSGATSGVAYSNPLTASGGTAPYSWTLTSGTLPAGIAVQSAGSLSGTTSQAGQFTFTVQASDSSSPKLTASGSLTLTVNGPLLPASFFGFSWNQTNSGTWPTVTYGMQRFWDSPALQWPDINTASGVFNFDKLDSDLALAFSKGTMQGMYTLARTPSWASADPTDATCNYTTGLGGGLGECHPPNDVKSDGSGTNAIWKAWITEIATHVNDPVYLQTHAHVKYWEIWNEPDTKAFFAGSIAQLARLTEDANCIITGRGVIHENGNGTATPCTATPIDPTAQIVMASAHAKSVALTYGQNELYCNKTSGIPSYELPCPNPPNAIANAVDIINFHMKPGNESGNNCPAPTPCTPESAQQMYISNIHSILQPAELAKPLWNGEAQYSSTGFINAYADVDMAASFMPRFYLLNWSLGLDGIAWYYANSQAQPVEAGTSYQQTYELLANASLVTPCAATGTVWSCEIITSGTQYLIMWDTAQSCANGSCTTANQIVASQWTEYQDTTTASTPITISGHVVPVGIKPVALH